MALLVQGITQALLLLLPEDQKQDLLEHKRQRLKAIPAEANAAIKIEIELFEAVLDTWLGRLDLLRDVPQDLLTYINPRRAGVAVYQKFGLRAVDLLEAEFLEDAYKIALPSLRFCGFLLIAFYGILAVLDIWCLPETHAIAWTIRAVVCSALIGTTWLSFQPDFKQHNQLVTAVAVFVAGLGNVVIIARSHPTELGHSTYYAGLHVLIMYINLLSGLRFFPALWVCLALVGCYEGTELWLNAAISTDSAAKVAFISSSFFMVADILFGCASANMRERSERISFMIRYAISHSFKDFLKYFEYQNPEIFLNNLSQIRYSSNRLATFVSQTYQSRSNLILPGTQPLSPLPDSSAALSALVGTPDNSPEKASGTLRSFANRIIKSIVGVKKWLNMLNPASFWRQLYKRICPNHNCQIQALEKAFEDNTFYGAIVPLRLLMIIAMAMFVGFSLDDIYCLPETLKISLPIRLTGLLVYAIIMALSFFPKLFQNIYKPMSCIGVAYAGFGIITMIVQSRPNEPGYALYYAGIIQTMYALFFLCQLPFSFAVSIGLAFVASYEFIAIVLQKLYLSGADIAVLINNSLFLVSAFVIGAIASNVTERNNWLEFLTLRGIAYKTSELLAYYESENPSPRQLLDLIGSIRHSPKRLEQFLLNLENLKNANL